MNDACRDLLDQTEGARDRDPYSWHTQPASLDSLWRACGEPKGKSPSAWRLLAGPLLTAIGRYEKDTGIPLDSRFWRWKVDDLSPRNWEEGDTMGPFWAAWLYAEWLDREEVEARRDRELKACLGMPIPRRPG